MSNTDNIAVLCRGVTKTYGSGGTRVRALSGVDLEVRTGELLMLVGPSGSGKTTLISVIAGVLDRDGGECLVFGHDFQRMTHYEKTQYRGRNIGFVFQMFNLIPTLTAAENVAVPLIINGTRRREAIGRRVISSAVWVSAIVQTHSPRNFQADSSSESPLHGQCYTTRSSLYATNPPVRLTMRLATGLWNCCARWRLVLTVHLLSLPTMPVFLNSLTA